MSHRTVGNCSACMAAVLCWDSMAMMRCRGLVQSQNAPAPTFTLLGPQTPPDSQRSREGDLVLRGDQHCGDTGPPQLWMCCGGDSRGRSCLQVGTLQSPEVVTLCPPALRGHQLAMPSVLQNPKVWIPCPGSLAD